MDEFFGTKKGILFINFLKYLFFFMCFYLFNIGGIRGEIFPFAFAFFIALCWCDQNVFFIGGLYVAACLLANFSVRTLLESLFCVFIILIDFIDFPYARNSPSKLGSSLA